MRKLITVLFLITSITLQAQISFEEVDLPSYNFLALKNEGDNDAADIDGDGDIDFIITGTDDSGAAFTVLYRNDDGNLIKVEDSFLDLWFGEVEFGDLDNDGDYDVVISGQDEPFTGYFLKIYINDGTGIFTESNNTLQGLIEPSLDIGDYDKDGDQDLIIIGENPISGNLQTTIYSNNGTAIFTEVTGDNIQDMAYGDVLFADTDSDLDNDVLISGISGGIRYFSLFENDGNGSFNIVSNPFTGVMTSSIAIEDLDGDNDLDIIISGAETSSIFSTRVYQNNGSNSFSEIISSGIKGVSPGEIKLSDIDNDNDLDLFISGQTALNDDISELYLNDGTATFTLQATPDIIPVRKSSVDIFDIDQDGFKDIINTGYDVSGDVSSGGIYLNNANTEFSKVEPSFPPLAEGDMVLEDFNGDGFNDIIVSAESDAKATPHTSLYFGDGAGGFTKVENDLFDDVWLSSIAAADIDGDNDIDLIIGGALDSFTSMASVKIYINDGSGNFSVSSQTFPTAYRGDIEFGDVDGDSDEDFVVTGRDVSGGADFATLYLNDGTGNFIAASAQPFTPVQNGDIEFLDVDNDQDEDLVLTGLFETTEFTALYVNDGDGNFTETTPFIAVYQSSIDYADVDLDNDLDILISGRDNTSTRTTNLYINDGNGNFTIKAATPFAGMEEADIKFADVDQDGDEDLLLTGEDGTSTNIYEFYENDGSGNFTIVTTLPFLGVKESSVEFGDIDGDTDLDLVYIGTSESQGSVFKAYKNITCPIWYADADADGFGDPNNFIAQCTQPTGYVSNNNDCDDTNSAINPQTVWYTDADGDGYGDPATSLTQCAEPAGYVLNSQDCDDTDATLNPETVWYADTDADGFGDPATSLVQCEQPTDYILDNNDCDDLDADVYPGAPAKADGKDNDCDGEIDKISQTITFDAIADQFLEEGSITLTATASSGLAVVYTVTSGPATAAGDVVTFTGAGTVTVEATQPGNENYLAASPVTQMFEVMSVTATIPGLEETTLSVYPNPATEVLNFSNVKDDIQMLQITDITGQVIEIIENPEKNEQVEVNNWKEGVYFILMKGANSQQTIKFIKR